MENYYRELLGLSTDRLSLTCPGYSTRKKRRCQRPSNLESREKLTQLIHDLHRKIGHDRIDERNAILSDFLPHLYKSIACYVHVHDHSSRKAIVRRWLQRLKHGKPWERLQHRPVSTNIITKTTTTSSSSSSSSCRSEHSSSPAASEQSSCDTFTASSSSNSTTPAPFVPEALFPDTQRDSFTTLPMKSPNQQILRHANLPSYEKVAIHDPFDPINSSSCAGKHQDFTCCEELGTHLHNGLADEDKACVPHTGDSLHADGSGDVESLVLPGLHTGAMDEQFFTPTTSVYETPTTLPATRSIGSETSIDDSLPDLWDLPINVVHVMSTCFICLSNLDATSPCYSVLQCPACKRRAHAHCYSKLTHFAQNYILICPVLMCGETRKPYLVETTAS